MSETDELVKRWLNRKLYIGWETRTATATLLTVMETKIERLQADRERYKAALHKIDGFNDFPARFNSEIQAVLDRVLRPALSDEAKEPTP